MTDYKLTREEYDGGQYIVAKDVRVGLEYGICGSPAALFVKECSRHENKIRFSRNATVSSGTSIMEIMCLEAHRGSRLDVLVEDLPQTDAQAIVKRLCNGLTTNEYYPNFDRREE